MNPPSLEMTRQECLDLIAGGGVGRVALCTPSGPRIYPVNYIVDRGQIVFRTAAYSLFGTTVHDQTVAFEVDELDYENASGWSVVVTGVAETVNDPDEIAVWADGGALQPWAEGARHLYLRIEPQGVSGRRVGADRVG
jgi:uncharacterized protein